MPSPFIARYFIDWLATQTVSRAQQIVVDEVKSRVESGDLGSYEGVLFKDAFKSPEGREFFNDVDLGVVVATKREIVGLLDKVSSLKRTKGSSFVYYFGVWKGRRLAVVQTGEGLELSREGTESLLQVFKPSRVVSVGFASSLTASLKRLALFVPEQLLFEDGTRFDLTSSTSTPNKDSGSVATEPNVAASVDDADFERPDSERRQKTLTTLATEMTSRYNFGTLLSVSSGKPVGELRQSASAYDHETWAVADACQKAGVPFLSLRTIYDVHSSTVSREATKVVAGNQSLARSLGAFFGATMKNPSSVLDVCKLKEEEIQAADKLADAICGLLLSIVVDKG